MFYTFHSTHNMAHFWKKKYNKNTVFSRKKKRKTNLFHLFFQNLKNKNMHRMKISLWELDQCNFTVGGPKLYPPKTWWKVNKLLEFHPVQKNGQVIKKCMYKWNIYKHRYFLLIMIHAWSQSFLRGKCAALFVCFFRTKVKRKELLSTNYQSRKRGPPKKSVQEEI